MPKAMARWDLPQPGLPKNSTGVPASTKPRPARSKITSGSMEGWKEKSKSSRVRPGREVGEAQASGQAAVAGGDSLLGH